MQPTSDDADRYIAAVATIIVLVINTVIIPNALPADYSTVAVGVGVIGLLRALRVQRSRALRGRRSTSHNDRSTTETE